MTAEERMAICKKCAMMTNDPTWGPTCDSTKFLNPETNESSKFPHVGWVRGCGCRMKWKVKSPSAHCVAKK